MTQQVTMTTNEIAERTGLSCETILREIRRGNLHATKRAQRWRVDLREARRWWRGRGGEGEAFGVEPSGRLTVVSAEIQLVLEDEAGRRFVTTTDRLKAVGERVEAEGAQLEIIDV